MICLKERINLLKSVLILVWEFPPGPGGIGQHAYSMAEALNQQDFTITILTTSDYGTPTEIKSFDAQHNHLNIVRVTGSRRIQYIKRIFQALRMAMQIKPVYIICSGKGALWLLLLMKLVARKSRLSAFVHGSEVRLPAIISRHFTWYSLRFADRLFCVSYFTKSLLPDSLRNRKVVEILPNGIRLAELPNERPAGLESIQSKGYPRLLTVGQLTKRKGQHRVIKALPQLRKRWPDIHYHMVGLDTDRESLMNLANKLHVENHITLHGRVSRETLYRAYVSSDIFMMLSENQPDGDVEGFGIAILEANFFGTPAVGAKYCGIEDAIKQGVTGFLVDGNDERAIAQAVDACLTGRSKMQRDMCLWVRQHDWSQLIKRFVV